MGSGEGVGGEREYSVKGGSRYIAMMLWLRMGWKLSMVDLLG